MHHGLKVMLHWSTLNADSQRMTFSHEFADMLHFWIAFKNFQRVAALQISQKTVRNGPLH